MKKKVISSQGEAHELALRSVAAARRKLRAGKASGKEQAVIRRSYERGDTNHDKGRLS
jgi:hypothetical protein